MTLDHVAPRRGQTAYDRRDNLVLACPGCNMAKRDQSPLAFLLGSRTRAANLLRYGSHLSAMLVDLARSLVPDWSVQGNGGSHSGNGHPVSANWPALGESDDESPYRD